MKVALLPKMPKYKLLALDLDGTLLTPQEEITPRVRKAVAQAVEAGCVVTLATGRRLRPAQRFASELGLNVPLILYSGGIIYDTNSQNALYHRPIPANFLKKAIELIPPDIGLGLLQSPLRGEYIWFGPPEHDSPFQRDYATNPKRADLVKRCDFQTLHQVEDVLTVTSIGPSANITRLTATLLSNLDCNIYRYKLRHAVHADLYGFDLLPPTNTKAHALEWLAAYYNLTLAETTVVGDGPNDVEMFKVAGLAVAMGNAIPDVKAVAHAVVGPNTQDGVAEAIERFIL